MTAVRTSSEITSSEPIQAALQLSGGARFYRCALQVNPFAYLERHSKQTAFESEADYNKAIVEACVETGIEIIGVTDHYRVKHSRSLVCAAREAGLRAFNGFEAVTKDGVHFLCLFDPEQDDALESFLGSCGIHDTDELSPTGILDSTELLECSKKWGAVCIAAHVISNNGGFLGDTSVHFTGNLNVLVGGRGAGKSTMIESIRYVLGLDPIGEDARKAHETHRRELLLEWEDIKASEYRQIEKAAGKVSDKLNGRVRVKVTMAGNRKPLEDTLREVGGRLADALERLSDLDQLSLPEFAQCCREGKESLMQHYRFPSGAAERIAGADPDLLMRIEELELPPTTWIELNTAVEGEPPIWQTLEALSTGQKATAVLLLLLLESEAPLVVDQPEDDLDNRFITEGVVPIMRQEKRRRQFVFSTHNANIPVLGDAEQILGLDASGGAKEGQARIAPEHMGSIDSGSVRELVEEILEGGKDAFEMRCFGYGF